MQYSAYLGSDILKRPNPLALTIIIPAASRSEHSDGRPPRKVMQTTYVRGGRFLYELLNSLRMTGHFPALNAMSGAIAVDNLNKSWDAYTRGMWPYSQYHSSIEPRVWWNGLRKDPSAFILAVNI